MSQLAHQHITRRLEKAKRQAARVREVLTAAGCGTYIRFNRDGTEFILCRACGLATSYGPDVKNRFCGFCNATHSEWAAEP